MITIVSSSRYGIDKKKLELSISSILKEKGISTSYDLNVVFVGKRKMKEIAQEYKNENIALPVLSFSYKNDKLEEAENLLGEIIICYPQTVLLAAEKVKTVDQTILKLINHGVDNILYKS